HEALEERPPCLSYLWNYCDGYHRSGRSADVLRPVTVVTNLREPQGFWEPRSRLALLPIFGDLVFVRLHRDERLHRSLDRQLKPTDAKTREVLIRVGVRSVRLGLDRTNIDLIGGH